jgi:hypothetical protein
LASDRARYRFIVVVGTVNDHVVHHYHRLDSSGPRTDEPSSTWEASSERLPMRDVDARRIRERRWRRIGEPRMLKS